MKGAGFDTIKIRDGREGVTPSFFPVILSALLLVRETDPRRYSRVRRFLPWTVNAPGPSVATYYHKIGCFVHFEEPAFEWQRPYTVAGYATTLVHEATHGVVRSFGIAYTSAVRSRIERLCWTELSSVSSASSHVRPARFGEVF